MLLAVMNCWIVLVTGQEDHFTTSTSNTQDVSTLLRSTNLTVSANLLTNYSSNLVEVEEPNDHISATTAIMKPTVQYTSTEPPSALELTRRGKTSEESEIGRTTLLITDSKHSETFNGLTESTETVNGVLETSPGVRIEIESATGTVSVRETMTGVPISVAPSLRISDVTETTEASSGRLETESTVTSESEALATEQFSVTEPGSAVPIYPDIPDLNAVSSTTEGPMFPFTIPSSSFGKHEPSHYHCIGPGRFPARPSCTEYHICRLAGFWFVHFKQTCHFGLQFSLLFGFCVPSYLSDCKIDPYLANVRRKDGARSEKDDSRSSEFEDESEKGRTGDVSRRNLWFPLMKKGRALY
jgi:hypothetical protein